MFRNWFMLVTLSLAGCVLYVEPIDGAPGNDHTPHYAGLDLWIEETFVSCTPYGDSSDWYMEASVGSWYNLSPSDIDVTIYIDGWDWYWTNNVGGYWFGRSFVSSYYECGEFLEFYFVAQDVNGNEYSTSLYWP